MPFYKRKGRGDAADFAGARFAVCYDSGAPALDGVSLDVHAGERIAVLGPNGAGKSTFFLCLNGVLTPESGQILLDGKPVDRKMRKALCERVGIVFQNADDQIIASTVAAEVSFGR